MSTQLAIANIALDTASVAVQGFGTLLFAGQHNVFPERVRTYYNLADMVADGFSTTSGSYIAAQGAFSQTIRPQFIKIGRQVITSIFDPTTVVDGLEYKITLNAQDVVAPVEFTYTASGGDTKQTVCDALKVAIDGNAGIAAKVTTTVVGTLDDAYLTIELTNKTDGSWFTFSDLLNLTEFVDPLGSTETAADLLNAISEEDDDYYHFTAEDKTSTFQLAAAADIEARFKYYTTTTLEAGSYATTPVGVIASLADSKYFRTRCFYHDQATNLHPEVGTVAETLFAVTGTITYANRQVAGVPAAKRVDGNPLRQGDVTNIKKVNGDTWCEVTFTGALSGASQPVITVTGKSASGEWTDNVITRDNMQVDIESNFTNFLINQKASKVPYNNKGLNQARNVLQTVLTQYTEEDGIHNFIEPDFEITIPDASDIPVIDKTNRVLKQITFKATLTGAIHMVEITGTLSV